MTVASVARQMLGAGVRDEVLVLIAPVPARRRRRRLFGRLGGASAGPDASARTRAAGDDPLAASSAKPFVLTGIVHKKCV
jgi:hypothetical protein